MSVDEYIRRFPKDVQDRLSEIRILGKKLEPDAKDAFSYGVPALKVDNKTFLIYAAFKNHIGIYPTPMIIESFRKELKDYETSKGAIKFPLSEPLPLPLIEKIIKACLMQEYTAVE
jgi:uncharacterized protein YdhG (YjbR/CyaY superfamily)